MMNTRIIFVYKEYFIYSHAQGDDIGVLYSQRVKQCYGDHDGQDGGGWAAGDAAAVSKSGILGRCIAQAPSSSSSMESR